MSQHTTKEGDILVRTAEDLRDLADVLLAPCDIEGELGVRLPDSGDFTPFILLHTVAPGRVVVRPLSPDRSVRLRAVGLGRPGDPVALAYARVSTERGWIEAVRPASATGHRRLIGFAEESFVDGQYARIRPTFGMI